MQVIVFRADDARFRQATRHDVGDLVTRTEGLRMVNRNSGSGTRVLIDRLLGGTRPAGYAIQPRSHHAVAAAVKQGRADWGVCIETVARQSGLGFLPLQEERYDFVVPISRWDRPAVQAFVRLLSEPSTGEHLAALGFRL
jgi:putative molybdopterin biosynthesis protein